MVPEGFPSAEDRPGDNPDTEPDNSPAGAVRRGIRALALELNVILPQTAEHAVDPADAEACRHGTRPANELSRCWEGRLGSFLNAKRRGL